MSREISQFMVDFTLPPILNDRFTTRIPEQRAKVNEFFMDGKLVSYAVSLEKSKLWAVFNAESESEVVAYIEALPLSRYMRYTIAELTFYNLVASKMPAFSIN
jgi:Muconolactone delta-isomerase